MIEYHVTLGRWPRELRDQPRAISARAQRAAVSAGMPLLLRHLALATPTGATGLARQSVTMEMGMGVGTVRGFVGYSGMSSLYIDFADRGTRPHWPPIAPITLWAARKFSLPLGSPEAKRAGYLVARAISRKGTKAQRFIENTVDSDRAQVQKIMADAALRAIEGVS